MEDTDTTSFVAEFVSTFSLFFPPVACLFNYLIVLTCLSSSLLCADFSLFFLRKQSLKVICWEMYHNWTHCAVIASAWGFIEEQVVAGCLLSLYTRESLSSSYRLVLKCCLSLMNKVNTELPSKGLTWQTNLCFFILLSHIILSAFILSTILGGQLSSAGDRSPW